MADPTLTPLAIPTLQGNPYYTQRTKLDDREYILRFAWNARAASWSLDVLANDGTPLAVGLRLVCDWPLLGAYQYDTRLPPGELVVVDTTGGDLSPPGIDELGIGFRCTLIYFAVSDATQGT